MTNIADNFVSVKSAERRRIKRKSKRMVRKEIVSKNETRKINYGEPGEIKTLKPRERRDEGRDSSAPRGIISR